MSDIIGDGGLPFKKLTLTGDDKGTVFTEQISVGEFNNGKEAVFGEGDSFPTDLTFHCDVADTSGFVISNATNITTITQSDSGSTTGLFGGEAAGKFLLVGNVDNFVGGFKVKINTAGIIEPINVVGEFLLTDGTWVTSPFMAVDDNAFPVPKQYGWNVCNEDNTSEQWFFGFNPLALGVVPDPVTLNINGSDITAYWGRFRIVSDITQDAVIEQIKSHTNRTEFQANGFQIKFGYARTPKTYTYGLRSVIPNGDADPGDKTVDYSTDFSVKYVDNRFANNAVDGFTFQQEIEYGIDTSIPLVVAFSYYVDGTSTGTIDFYLDKVSVNDGFLYGGTEPKMTYQPYVQQVITEDSDHIRRTVQFLIFVNDSNVRDAIVFNFYRNGQTDTLGNNIIITNIQVTGYTYI